MNQVMLHRRHRGYQIIQGPVLRRMHPDSEQDGLAWSCLCRLLSQSKDHVMFGTRRIEPEFKAQTRKVGQ